MQHGFHQTVSTTEKNPGLAAVLSFLIPGLGQIYNGQVGMGILLCVITILLYMTIVLGLALHLYLVFDAYRSAEKFNKNRMNM
jgi:TM2 domain-containing membrane protein YozV